ncbi:hypothetical protein CY34DRAFT_804661 [Suillus luteus UH-Slu-Lm8-n1]|uniref:Uncharacterized protein n=1 Tax=Suillus luteus UH-Slu-Lm8-n1 TaxID=930992 RepID=A0A0D0B8F6_9AGAM|nr:hypothetical protein CY34DRAFT_804661 [Suillus luteus UH-Slu-Lm8-n1]
MLTQAKNCDTLFLSRRDSCKQLIFCSANDTKPVTLPRGCDGLHGFAKVLVANCHSIPGAQRLRHQMILSNELFEGPAQEQK